MSGWNDIFFKDGGKNATEEEIRETSGQVKAAIDRFVARAQEMNFM